MTIATSDRADQRDGRSCPSRLRALVRCGGRVAQSILAILVTAILLALMSLTTADVIGRYFLSTPIPGALEITELLLGALVFSALPLVTYGKEHVTIDLLDNVASGWLDAAWRAAVGLVVSACCTFLAYKMWMRAEDMRASNDITHILRIPIYPAVYGASILLAVSAVCALVSIPSREPSREQESGHV